MLRLLFLLLLLIGMNCCTDPVVELPKTTEQSNQLTPLGIHRESSERPTIAHVKIADLNMDGLLDVLVCDVSNQQVSWIRQEVNGSFTEKQILSNVQGPVHVEAIDFDSDGDLDVLIAAMGVILPSDAHLGQVIILENDGKENFTTHLIADEIQRVTDVQAGDLDGDGDMDLAVAQFGYTQGRVQWFQNEGEWNFTQHLLIARSGAIHAPIVDIDNDGDLDILALLSQEWETVYGFINDGSGSFEQIILHDVADADFSSSGITIADLDQDGDQDVIWTNGDAFVAVDYRPLPTHGLQWLENRGELQFTYHRIGQLDGAYGPTAADMDGDGDLDIVTVAEFAHWDEPDTASIVWWEQGAGGSFSKHVIAKQPTHLVTCDVGDIDGNGFPDIVVGGMALYPPFDRITRVSIWSNDGNFGTTSNVDHELPIAVQEKLQAATTAGDQGMVLHANGFDAEHKYRIASVEDPTNPRWFYYLGLLDVAVGNSEVALRTFERAEQLDATYAPLQTRLGELYTGRGEIDLAKEKFSKANTPHATVSLAQLAADTGEWNEVVQILDGTEIPAAIALRLIAQAELENKPHQLFAAVDMGYQMDDPWLAEVDALCVLAPQLVTQAQTKIIGGKIGEAELLLQRAISLDPKDKDARLALATILLRAESVDAGIIAIAIKHLEVGLQIDPTYVMTRAKYGWALYLANRHDEARSVWRSVLVDEPLHGPVLTNLAQLELQQKQYEKAYEYYAMSFHVAQDSPFALSTQPAQQAAMLYGFALAASKLNKTQEVIESLKLALEFAPSDPTIHFELGNTFIGMKDFSGALQHMEIANALLPNNPRMLAALGYTWSNLGEQQVALGFLQESVSIAPAFALGWYHLGNVQVALGLMDEARDSLTIAVQLQPTFRAAKKALEELP